MNNYTHTCDYDCTNLSAEYSRCYCWIDLCNARIKEMAIAQMMPTYMDVHHSLYLFSAVSIIAYTGGFSL